MKKYICKKKLLIIALIICSFLFLNINIFAQTLDQEDRIICHATMEDDFSENEILVVLNKRLSMEKRSFEPKEFDAIDCLDIEELTSQNNPEQEISDNFRRILKLTIRSNEKSKVLDAIKILEKRKDILSAEPNYYDKSNAEPNDFSSFYQYAIKKIELPSAWEYTTGSDDVVVGIIDTGIDGTHKDLLPSIDKNLSKCFSNDFTNPLEDSVGHGTHVAGIIGAKGNNDLGITGVNWNVRLASLRIDNSKGEFPEDNIIKAVNYANDMGIKILNYSGGGYGRFANASVQALKNYNGLFVCSAGNDAKNLDIYSYFPSYYQLPNMITVGSTDSLDNRCENSNFGATKVDVYAPGNLIYSTIPGNRYFYMSGTSMAAPHVTGLAALLLSVNPNLTFSQIKNAILDGSNDIIISVPSGNGTTTQNVKRINAHNSIECILNSSALDSYYLDYDTLKIDKSINSNSSYFVEKNAMIKLSKDNYQFGFTITSTAKMEVMVLDGDFNEVDISKTIMNDGCKIFFDPVLESGVYYLKVNYTSPTTSGQININIHSHTYEDHYCTICDSYTDSHYFHDPYTWLNTKQHRATCGCSATTKQGHAVLENDYSSGKSVALCILCGGRADIGFVTDIGLLSLGESRKVTKNGSFILPNGVIVLVEEDVEAYILDSLVFYEESILLVNYNFM